MRSFQKKLWFHLLRIAGIFIFGTLVSATILFAEGYHYDRDKQHFVKKSVIMIQPFPEGASVFLDGQAIEVSFPLGELRVLPGVHDLSFERNGDFVWQRKVTVFENEVLRITDVIGGEVFPFSYAASDGEIF